MQQGPGAYCIIFFTRDKLVILASFFSYVKINGKNHANLSFQILPEFFSGKSCMQWALGLRFTKGLRSIVGLISVKTPWQIVYYENLQLIANLCDNRTQIFSTVVQTDSRFTDLPLPSLTLFTSQKHNIHDQACTGGWGAFKHPPSPFGSFFFVAFCLLACLSERLVIHTRKPLTCVWKIDQTTLRKEKKRCQEGWCGIMAWMQC